GSWQNIFDVEQTSTAHDVPSGISVAACLNTNAAPPRRSASRKKSPAIVPSSPNRTEVNYGRKPVQSNRRMSRNPAGGCHDGGKLPQNLCKTTRCRGVLRLFRYSWSGSGFLPPIFFSLANTASTLRSSLDLLETGSSSGSLRVVSDA